MSALLDEARSVISAFREHIAQDTNSGMLLTIDRHLNVLATAATQGVDVAETAVKNVLYELYTALHGAPAAAEPTPAPATGGTVQAPPAITGESGPETIAMPAAATVVPESPAPATSGVLGETADPAEPAAAETPAA